jgi:ADP-ribose pyrophosphatase YjhB (NUDIX family)/RimJ/RimL family protein N-acetyltransferase
MTITFEPLHESHFPLLLKWLETPHVKKWWDQDVKYTLELVREKYGSYVKGYKLEDGQQKPIQGFIIYSSQNPVGYIQIYNAYDFPRSMSLLGLPENLGAFDIFIGEAAVLQQGLGSKAILEFLRQHGKLYTHIFVDPDSNNVAAIKAYEKAGFKVLSEQQDTKEVWMIKDLLDIANPRVGLGVLIFNLNGQILLGKRKNSLGESSWGPPGGHLEFGETFEECAIRETIEETGLIIENPKFFTVTNDIYKEKQKHYISIFMKAQLKNDQLVQNLEPDKHEDWQWFHLNNLPENFFAPLKQLLLSLSYGQNLDVEDFEILEELKSREPIFHHPEKFGKTKQDISKQMCDEFWEVGASGNVYTKQDVIEILLERYNNPYTFDIWEAKDFELTKIAQDNYLLTYILTQNKTRITRRSTFWRKEVGSWKILYHQGTVIDGGSV